MNRFVAVVASLSLAFVGVSAAFAGTINVPGDQPTIQGAINTSVNGDVINIAAGIYNETYVDTDGKAITIQGTLNSNGTPATIIDAQQNGSVLVFQSGEGPGTVIKDLVLTMGFEPPPLSGGGIYCYGSNPTISDCIIVGNFATHGGGIYCDHSNPTITRCIITDNGALRGGGIYCANNSSPIHSDCYFFENHPDNVYGDADWNPLRGEEGPSIITLENCTLCGTGEHVSGLIVHVGENHISDCIDDGDLDGDGDVDTDDLDALHDALGIELTDVNNNGCVDIDDLLYVIEDWNEGCTP
ncbi:MAG: hypothetical protein P8M22_01045 [Phycisphaerales bacterium]|nr:hypothetical protein [Phycisphaerales bacterium]